MTRDRGLRRRSMAGILMIFLLSSLLGLHSTESQMDDKQVRFPSICPGLRCPRGHSSYCPLQVQNQTASCIPCEKGTYSMHSSRRRACRPCSRCRSNEFELWPCSQTSDVVCKECRRCPPGVEVLVSCQRTRDTICREKCRLPLQFQDIQGAGCERAKPQITGDHTLSTEQKQGKEMHNDSLTIIVQNRTTKAISPTQSSLTLPPYEIKTKIMFSRDPSAVTRKSKLLIMKTELRAAVTRRSSGNYDVEMPNPGNKSGSDTKLSLNAVLTISLLAVILLSLIFSGILMQRYKKSAAKKGCLDVQSEFGECLRESRCLPSSDCCTVESTLSCDSNSDKTEECHVPRPVLGSLQMQVTVDVHSSVCDVLPTITESCQCTRSYPEFITSVENIFDSNGGTLSHPDSNVSINVDSGAIPDGVSQRIFFQVVYDERLLLRDIPQTPGNTLICPVIQCGPGNISLLKPVEIVLPHCLYLDETKKESIIVYKCERFSDQGPLNWERIPSASEKNNQSKAWFTVKMDTIHIKTKTFSFWSVFSCGGPKKKRATVFASKPNPLTDLLYLRFYIYSDNDDSKKRVERKDREQFSDSKRSKEKPFKVYNDSKDIIVWLNPEDLSKDGWEMDKTAYTQIYSCESAYKNGFRSKDSCDFAVKPIAARVGSVKGFSCDLKFQQEDHREHSIYVNPGFSPVAKQSVLPFSDESNTSSTSTSSSSSNVKCQSLTTRETANGDDKPSSVSSVKLPQQPTGRDDEPVTEKHCRCICSDIGSQWKPVLRNLPGIKEKHLENLEEDYKNCKVNEKCLQGLLEWRRIAGPQKATTRALCKSLQQEGCLDALEDLWKGGFERNSPAAIPESTAEMCV